MNPHILRLSNAVSPRLPTSKRWTPRSVEAALATPLVAVCAGTFFLCASNLCAPGSRATAQDMTFEIDESTGEIQTGDTEARNADDDFIASLAENNSITGDDKGDGPRDEVERERAEEIYAVQQVYALRLNRFELSPMVGFTLNDPFVSHTSLGLSANYWLTNVLAVGASFQWYDGLEDESDLTFFVRRSTRLAVPVSEYQLGAYLNATYVPLYGKFAFLNKYIFEWDAYLVGGMGIMRTRPIPVIDPEARSFDFGNRLAFNIGLGLRVFVTRWLAVMTEVRNYMFLDKVENQLVEVGEDRFNEDTWFANGVSFVNNVSVHLGLTVFFPFTFEYKQPK